MWVWVLRCQAPGACGGVLGLGECVLHCRYILIDGVWRSLGGIGSGGFGGDLWFVRFGRWWSSGWAVSVGGYWIGVLGGSGMVRTAKTYPRG